MTTLALKKKIYSRLKGAKNKHILEDIYKLLQLEEIEDEPFQLSKEELRKIKSGQAQIKQGKVKTQKEANKAIEKWLVK